MLCLVFLVCLCCVQVKALNNISIVDRQIFIWKIVGSVEGKIVLRSSSNASSEVVFADSAHHHQYILKAPSNNDSQLELVIETMQGKELLFVGLLVLPTNCSIVDMGNLYVDSNKVSFKRINENANNVDRSSLCYYDQRIYWCNDLCGHSKLGSYSSQFVRNICNCGRNDESNVQSNHNLSHNGVQLYSSNPMYVREPNYLEFSSHYCPYIPTGIGVNITEYWFKVVEAVSKPNIEMKFKGANLPMVVDKTDLDLVIHLPLEQLTLISACLPMLILMSIYVMSRIGHKVLSAPPPSTAKMYETVVPMDDPCCPSPRVHSSSIHTAKYKTPTPNPETSTTAMNETIETERNHLPPNESLILNHHYHAGTSSHADIDQYVHNVMKHPTAKVILIKGKGARVSSENSNQRMVYHYYSSMTGSRQGNGVDVRSGIDVMMETPGGANAIPTISQEPPPVSPMRKTQLKTATTSSPVTSQRNFVYTPTSTPAKAAYTSTLSPIIPIDNDIDDLLFRIDKYSHVRKHELTRLAIEQEMLQLYEQDIEVSQY